MLRRTLLAGFSALFMTPSAAQERSITLASSDFMERTGLFAHIIPQFRQKTGLNVRVVAVRVGQTFEIGAAGEADALLVNDEPREHKFIAEGHGLDRREVMFNDAIIVGPATDPANIRGLRSAPEAFRRIARSRALFLSRGDESSMHRMELRLWRVAGVEKPEGEWYKEVRQGMGPTLNVAAGMNAYAFTGRAAWARFQGRHALDLLAGGDPALFNRYSSILVNPSKGTHIRAAEARIWHEWLTSPEGREAIASFRIRGEQVFFLPGSVPSL